MYRYQSHVHKTFASLCLRPQLVESLTTGESMFYHFRSFSDKGFEQSTQTQSPQEKSSAKNVEPNINRLLYHARQRGWLELDLIVGKWAEDHLHSLTKEQLEEFHDLLNIENPYLFKYLTGQLEADQNLSSNAVFQMIKKDVQDRLKFYGGFSSSRAPHGVAWVRGWDDGKAS